MPRQRGFTLIEVLVVLTIIIVISLSALPAIRFIMGSRSIEGTQNLAAAMISRARAQAVADGEQRGVFFFVDPANDRTTMALVGLGGGDLDQYHGWTQNSLASSQFFDAPSYTAGTFQYYASGDPVNTQSRVISLTSALAAADTNFRYLNVTRLDVRPYAALQTHTPSAANRAGTLTGNAFWGAATTDLSFLANTDFQLLPQGVGVQLINSNPTGQPNFDRYLRTGVIMFDRFGRFESIPYSVSKSSTLGLAMHLSANMQPPGLSLYSQFGLVLYDRQTFLAQSSGASNFTEVDFILKGFFDPAIYPASSFPTAFPDEQTEEAWIDANSLPLLINRYNGSLIKGE